MQTKKVLQQIVKSESVTGRSGRVHKLHSGIAPAAGEFVAKLISSDDSIVRTLEIGCAYGISSLFVCGAIAGRKGASHTIIDPFQNSVWDGVGTKNLEDAGVSFFKLIEAKSEIAMPRLLESNEGQFDLVFIDGWHTFDHTLLDLFYATRLVRVGGYVAIDDVIWPSVSRAVSFVRNYPCYEQQGTEDVIVSPSWKKVLARILMSPVSRRTWARLIHPSVYRRIYGDSQSNGGGIVVLKKVAEDERNWDWHVDSF